MAAPWDGSDNLAVCMLEGLWVADVEVRCIQGALIELEPTPEGCAEKERGDEHQPACAVKDYVDGLSFPSMLGCCPFANVHQQRATEERHRKQRRDPIAMPLR